MKAWVILICAVIFLAACTPSPQPQEQVVPQPEPQPIEEPAPVVPEEVPVEPAPQAEMTKRVKDLLAKADKTVTSYAYTYRGLPDRAMELSFSVRADKIKVELPFQTVVTPGTNYDTIFLDTMEQTGVAYCREESLNRCPDPERVFQVQYDTYFRRTPYQWLKLVTYAEETGSAAIDGRQTIRLTADIEGKQTLLFLDTFYGLPLKVEQGEDIYEFRRLIANQVTEEDVTP